MTRLPPESFDYYVELGPDRSYEQVAERFGVSKAAVGKKATREEWQQRVRNLERLARARNEPKLVDSLAAVHERQIKAARFLQAKALEFMKSAPPERAIRAAGALAVAWKHELLLLGEPTERQANVEDVLKRQYAQWMTYEDSVPLRSQRERGGAEDGAVGDAEDGAAGDDDAPDRPAGGDARSAP